MKKDHNYYTVVFTQKQGTFFVPKTLAASAFKNKMKPTDEELFMFKMSNDWVSMQLQKPKH